MCRGWRTLPAVSHFGNCEAELGGLVCRTARSGAVTAQGPGRPPKIEDTLDDTPALEQIRLSAHAMPFPDELEGFHPRRTAVRHILVWLENSPPSLAPW